MQYINNALRTLVVCAVLLFSTSSIFAQTFVENFNDITTLTGSGWVQQNNSSPVGSTSWFQGVPATFVAFNGATNAYIGANFNNTSGNNTISNWLITPNRTLNNGDTLKFRTRTTANPSSFPDRLELRLSTNGASTDVGVTSTSVGDFTTLLISVNPSLTTTGYPGVWTQYVAVVSGLSGPTSGRFAFRYFVTNGGSGANSNYIGIDNVVYRPLGFLCPTLSISPSTLPDGAFNTSYSQTITQTGGILPVSFTVSSGSLPVGITLSNAGVLSGTPTVVGLFSFEVTATDANECSGVINYTLNIACPANPTTIPYSVCLNGTVPGGQGLQATGCSSTTFASFSGSLLNGDPTFIRTADNSLASYTSSGVQRRYRTHSFTVTVTGVYTFNHCGTSPTNWDAFAHLYQNSFTPATPAVNFVIAGDDGGTGCGTGPNFSATLTAGTTYIYVATEWGSSTATRAYNITWTGPGSLVSEVTLWYASVSGGSILGTGTVFNPVGVSGSGITNTATSDTTTFYAACSSLPTCRVAVDFAVLSGPVAVCQDATIYLDGSGNATVSAAQVDNGSSAACGIQSLDVSPNAYTCGDIVGTNTVTLTVTDNGGNTATCQATVTVLDTVSPVIACLADIVVSNTAGACNAVVNFANVIANDNCGSASVTQTAGLASGSTFPVGTTTNTFVATDGSGNADTCSFTVTVQDTTAPVINCPANITVSNTAGNCSAPVTFANATAAMGCGVGCATTLPDNVNGTYLGSFEGHHYLLSNNSTDWNTANTEAQALGGQLASINSANENAFIAVGLAGLETWIGGFQNFANPNYSEPSNGWEWTDGSPFNYTNWDSGQPDNFGIGEDKLHFTAGGLWNDLPSTSSLSYVVEFSCPVLVAQTGGLASGSTFPAGTSTVEYVAINGFGGASSTCSFTVTVQDTSKPVIACPADIAVSNEVGTCGAVVNYSLPTVTENCNPVDSITFPTTILAHGGGAVTALGNNTFGGYFFDLTNNASQDVTVTGFQIRFGAFVNGVVPSPQTVEAYYTTSLSTYVGNNTNSGAWTSAGSASVAVAGANGEFSQFTLPSSFTLAAGATKGIYIFAPNAGLLYNGSGTSNFTPITVGDLTLTPGLASASLFDNSGFTPRIPNVQVQYFAPFDTADIDLISGLPSGSTFPVGVTTNTFVATDAAGNTDTCSFTVTVADTSAPTAVCQSATVYLDGNGNATLTAAQVNNGSIDLCSGIASLSVSPNTFTCAELGANTVTLTVTDSAGNSSTCSATVTVADTISVVIACPSDITVSNEAGTCGAVVTYAAPTTSDNCTPTAVPVTVAYSGTLPDSIPDGVGIVPGVITISEAVTAFGGADALGTDVFLDSVYVQISHTWVGDLSAFLTAPNGTVITLLQRPGFPATSFGCVNNNVNLTIIPGSGADAENTCNLSTNILTFAINGQFTAHAGEDLNSINTNGGLANGNWLLAVSDDAGGDLGAIRGFTLYFSQIPQSAVTVTQIEGLASGSTFPVGSTINTFVANDGFATDTCSFTVTVADTSKPNAVCQNATAYTDVNGNANLTAIQINNGSNDLCSGIASLSVLPNTFTCANIGATNTVTLTVTDSAGNSNTCDAIVTVLDTVSPLAVCKAATIYLDANGNAILAASDVNNNSTDNCAIQSLSVLPNTFTCADLGANTVTLTVTDNYNNTATCQATVTVADTVAPVITCPTNVSVNNGTGSCGAVVTYNTPSASDACATSSVVPVTINQTGLPANIPDANSIGLVNTLNVTQFGGADVLGGAVTLNSVCFAINHTWVGDLSVGLRAPDGTFVSLMQRPGRVASGFGCGGANLSVCVVPGTTGTRIEGACTGVGVNPGIPSGNYIAHFTYDLANINLAGGLANGNWQLVVVDSAGGDTGALQAWSLNFSQAVSAFVAVAQTAGLPSGSTFPVGTTTNTFVATDANGNTDTCSFTVTVADTTKPTAACKNFTLQLDINGNGTLIPADVNNGSSDNCGIQFFSVSPNTFTCANIGANTATLTVTDTAGNSSTCTATVTVNSYTATLTGSPLATTQLINEGFAVVPSAGWVVTNNSTPVGLNSWFQGVPTNFPAFNGPTNSYASVNFNSVTGNNTISNWLILPNITLKNGDVFTFRTRKPTVTLLNDFPDRLQVRQSTNGASVNVGNTNTSVGDFNTLLLDINPTLVPGGYPLTWTQFTVTISGLSGPTSGRLAFRYFVTSGGPAGANSDLIGIDDVVYTSIGDTICVGEPANLTVTTTGGASPYSVVYSDGVNTSTVNPYTSGTNIPVSPAVTTTYTLVSVTDANGCTASPASGTATIAVYPAVTVSAASDQVVCTNQSTTAVTFTGTGTSYTWTNSEPSIGLAASGSGNIAAFTATNTGSTPVVAEIIVTPTDAVTGCVGTPDTFTITVNPNLTVDPTADQVLCVNENSAAVNFTGTGADYSWTNDNTAVGLAASGTGNIASFVATNTGTTPLVATIVVTPTGNACPATNDTFTITVNPGPVAVCQDVTVYLDGTGNATVTAAQVDNGSTAGCGVQSLTVSPNTFNCGTAGANTVTLTLTDNGGNVSTCQATVTVLDTVAPVVVCPGDITTGNSPGICGAVVTYPTVTFTDNCGGVVTNPVTINQTGLPVNIPDGNATGITNTLNVTQFGSDLLGGNVTLNSVCFEIRHTWVGDLNVSLRAPNGTVIPLAARPGFPALTFGCTQENINACVTTGVGADMENVCNPSIGIGTFAISGNYFAHAGADLNAINTAGGLANGAWQLIVSDNSNFDVGSIQAWSLNFTQTQNLGGSVTQIAGLASGGTFPIGTTTNTFVATDPSGNTDTCSFDVVVNDTEAPKFAGGGQNCAALTAFDISFTGVGFLSFIDEVSWQLFDASNNVVASGGAPGVAGTASVYTGTISNGPFTLVVNSGGANPNFFNDNEVNITVTSFGNLIATGFVAGTAAGGTGTTSITNLCGFEGGCSADVEVNAAPGDCDAVVNYIVPIATDNCPGVTLTQTSGLPSGSTFPSGNTTVTYEAVDAAGNVSTCSFKVTVFEVTPPTAICQDVTAYLDATGNVTITAAQADGGSFDNCGIDSLSLSRYTFSCRDVGMHTIQLFVTDLSGNVDACNATVTIIDTISYQIICPSDIVVSNDLGQCGAVVNFSLPATYDNCADTARLTHSFNDVILDGNSVACANTLGHSDNRYLRVYDLNQFGYGVGNDFEVTNVQFGIEGAFSTGGSQPAVVNLYTLSGPLNYANMTLVATQNVTITDQDLTLFNLPMTVTIPGGSTLVIELHTPNGQASGNFFYIGSNSFGQTGQSYVVFPPAGCGGHTQPTDLATVGYPSMEIILNVLSVPAETVTQIAGPPSGSTFPVGTTVITYAADNGSGSTDTCSFNVIVNDTELPVAVCQDVTVYLDANGSASITTADINNGSTDNCGIETITLSQEVFSCAEAGTNTVTLTVTDTAGNVGTCTATVTVLDTIAPLAVCTNATVYLDANGTVTVLGTDIDGGTTDNCGVTTITVIPNTFTCADRDSTYQVSVTFTDAAGNSSFCTADVTIADTLRPVAICQNINIQLDINGNATITAGQIDNGSYDNCNIASITISPSTFTCANTGANTVTLSVTDSSGNVGTCDAIVTVDASATIDSFTLSNYNGFNVSCYGSTDGTATVHTTSTFPVTYLWSDGQSTQTATGLAAGQYFITVTAGTCEFVDSVTLTQPDSLSINPVLSNYNGFGVRCFGSNDGTITLNVTGGVPAYNYAWPATSAIGNSYTANGLLPGIYNITVTDLNGCTKVTSPELTQPTQVQTTISAVAPKCNGGTDGIATVVASGGTSVFTYLWNTVPAQTNATATGLGAGTYTVTVSDGNGCTSVNSITIAQPAALVAIAQRTSNFNGFGVSCFGGNNGTGSVTVIGGTSPFSYAWSGGTVSGNTVTGLSAGTFTVTVTDANGCSAVDSITVTQPARITATATVTSNFNGTPISCNGAADGQLTANGTGGVAPYFYEWNTNPVQSSKVATGVGAGTYIVTITDLNGCTDTASITITAPIAITATGAVTSNFNGFGVSCFGGNNGAATITATGGTGTLNYAWPATSGVGNTASATSLTAGTYVVTVTDTNSCSTTVSITVTQPAQVTAVASKTDVNCFGSSDGKAWVTATGGVPGYIYSWNTNPVQTTDTARNLIAGSYTVVVSDQNGCSSTATVVVGAPNALVANANGEGVTCPSGNDGRATATATGGTGSYTFSWSTTPAQTGASATGLAAGTYTVTVTDGNGCTATDTAVIIVKYPTLPTATVSGGGSVCADESRPDVFVTFTGLAPYSFTLNNGTATTNYTGVTQNPFVISNAGAGTYTVTNFSDANCTGTASGSAVVRVSPVPSVFVTGGGFVCDGERLPSVEVEFTGTGPWDVVIRIPEGRDTLITGNTTSPLVFNPSTEGFYVVRSVSDANGCVAFNLNVTKEVGFYLLPLVDAGETKSVDRGQGVVLDGRVITAYGGAVSYDWSPDSSLSSGMVERPTARPFETTLYTLTATDRNGCSASDTVTVIVTENIVFDIINVFTPDGDGINEFFVIRNRSTFGVLELTIVNRWGNILYESDDYANNWDGTWKGKPVDDGTYYYVIKDVASGKYIKGAVTILRNND